LFVVRLFILGFMPLFVLDFMRLFVLDFMRLFFLDFMLCGVYRCNSRWPGDGRRPRLNSRPIQMAKSRLRE
jgi:hypothetical protein